MTRATLAGLTLGNRTYNPIPNHPSVARINSLIRNTVLLQMVSNNAKSRANPYNMGNMGSMAIFGYIFWCGNIIFYCEKWLWVE